MWHYEVSRSATIQAEAATVHGLIDDFHQWTRWSPWEDLDPSLSRIYSGEPAGVGARYAWEGNRKAGQGSMEITGSTPEQVSITLRFLKPFTSDNQVDFRLEPQGGATRVTWRMRGEQKGVMAFFGKLVSMDKLVGKDFEKGLTRLKATAESSG